MSRVTIDAETKRAFVERLRKDAERTSVPESNFVLARMLQNIIPDHPALAQIGHVTIPRFKEQRILDRAVYFVLDEESEQQSNNIQRIFAESNVIEQLAEKIIEQVESKDYPSTQLQHPLALLESCFYREYARSSRELLDVEEHPMGGHTVFRGVPTSAISQERLASNEFFSLPHRGTKNLMDYAIATPQRPGIHGGNVRTYAKHRSLR